MGGVLLICHVGYLENLALECFKNGKVVTADKWRCVPWGLSWDLRKVRKIDKNF